MNVCARRNEVEGTVRAGQWPHGCAAELREHVGTCAQCAEEAWLSSAFAASRESAMVMAAPQSAELIWWRAQLRRRREAVERLNRPGVAISIAAIAGSIILLLLALATFWKRAAWTQLAISFSFAGWNAWVLALVAAVLCGFAAVAVGVFLGMSDERE